MSTTADASAYPWLTSDAVARQAALRPRKLAVREFAHGRETTFAGLEHSVRQCDALLRSMVSPGARVALLARNSLHHLTLFYGCPRAGAVFTPLNWRLSGPELAGLLEDAAPELLIYDHEFEDAARTALAAAPGARTLRIGPDGDALGEALGLVAPREPSPIDPLAPSMLLYTSGTTGKPKGVIVTPKTTFYSAMNYTFVGEFSAEHAQLCDVPLFHVVGLLAVMHGAVLAGARLYLADRFQPAATLARLADPGLGITHYFCVPQMAQSLVDEARGELTALEGLRMFTGGAPMPPELSRTLADAGALPSNGYGMSENGTVLGMPLDAEIAREKLGSAGVPSPAMEARLVGPDGRDVAVGEVGEIWLRGPSVTPGYWNQPDATAKAFEGDWFKTGDAARRDADGYYFIVDRWKDMYISGGENVYPAEVEVVLAAMDQVAEAAVVGAPDARWGEVGCAWLVLRPGACCDAAAVAAWCETRLARYKCPAYVRFIDALPRTASGKILKDELRRAFAETATEQTS